MERPNLQALDWACYPVLHAISQKPMTTGSIAKVLQSPPRIVLRRLNQLEDAGLVVRRYDMKWIPHTIIAAVDAQGKVVRVVQEPSQEAISAPVASTPRAEADPRLQDALNRPTERALVRVVKPGPTGKGVINASNYAKKVSDALHVPVWITHRGEVSMATGQLAPCEQCKNATPLRYGKSPICPVCARKS